MVTLVILDGFGINKSTVGNAIKLAGTPNLDKLNIFPHTQIEASGEYVGLLKGQMGNSEVGHLNLGAGRVVYQDLPKISREIESGKFFENEAINKTIEHALKNNSSLHIMGLLSDGGVHSHITHLKAIVDLANKKGLSNIYLHAFLDGRDTLRDSGIGFVKDIMSYIKGKAVLATLCGRIYAMDRENRWDRIKKAYDMLTLGEANYHFSSAIDALEDSYKREVFDEFVEPTIIGDKHIITDNDAVIFFNYRTDRAREITEALTQDKFNGFNRTKIKNLCYCCMTEYSADFENVLVAYPPEKIQDNLSAIISKAGLTQFHTSETTKYAHVTFFFNGGIEEANPGEKRKLIDSYNVKNFAEVPEMRAPEITSEVIKAIKSHKYDFILANISNPDMIGHTGNLDAAIKAIKVVDECAGQIAQTAINESVDLIITADHGNCEEMIDKNGNVLTQHTTNPVPVWVVSQKHKSEKLITGGKLSNIAPTVLKMLGLKIKKDMEKPLF